MKSEKLDKIIVQSALSTLGGIALLCLIAFSIASLLFPSTMMQISYRLGNDSGAMKYANRAYKGTGDIYYIAYATEVAIGIDEYADIETYAQEFIANENFSSYCEAVDEKTVLVSVMTVNNEIGAINPIKEICAAAKKKKCIAAEEMSAASVLGGTEMPQSEAAEESAPAEEEGKPTETTSATMPDSVPLRKSERHVKHRMLLSYNALGHEIEYRRVKKTNELVIDGNVYAEYTALMERSHQLTAVVDGHCFEVGFDSLSSQSYLSIDGQLVHSKLRWY